MSYKTYLNEKRLSVRRSLDRYPKARLVIKIFLFTFIILFAILFVSFILIFVIGPIVFMLSNNIQRFVVFFNVDHPRSPKFDNPDYYGIQGVQNFYLTIQKNSKEHELLSLGLWFIANEKYIDSKDSINDILKNTQKPVLVYLHGSGCNRISPSPTKYGVLRKSFHIISIDYRGFGDSTDATLTEEAVVDDVTETCNWLRNKTGSDIYIWGHSLGGAIATKATMNLIQTVNPSGLVIESSFTSLREEAYYHPFGKWFRWLAYFESTMLDPLEKNGLIFNNKLNIGNVDCPIMLLHAEDDSVVPFDLGRKLYQVARDNRKNIQGPVIFHTFLGTLGYGHLRLTSDPYITTYISNFIGICDKFKKKIQTNDG